MTRYELTSHQWYYHDAMVAVADHDRAQAPHAVLVEVPLRLDPLDGCAAFVTWRRRKLDELGSGHG